MLTLADLIQRWPMGGRVVWIGTRPKRRSSMEALPETDIGAAGLIGDHSKAGKRAVTLIQAEHLNAIGAYLGRSDPVAAADLRRNLVVAGLNLSALKGRQVNVGTAILRITSICAPCSRMEETFGHGGYSAVRGHGGWCAEVIEPGRVCLEDEITPID
ncbi:MAG: MOSC domain-containing protein [Paracoccaceae bacterium]